MINEHMNTHELGHSTETALLNVKADIMEHRPIYHRKGVFLVLLDQLSAAFCTAFC